MRLSKIFYFSEFLLFPVFVVTAASFAFRDLAAPRFIVLALVYCIGLASWTLIEYLLHRVFFHHAPLLTPIHERHHISPLDLIGTPVWASVSIALIAIALPSIAMLGFDLGTSLTGGMATGYLWYVFVHHATHHSRPRKGSYLYTARQRHARHHHYATGNFGVTTDLWDCVFGTTLGLNAQRPVNSK